MRIGIAITRAASVDATWTTVHLAQAALSRGHSVRFIEPWDFEADSRGQLVARSHAFEPPGSDAESLANALIQRAAPRRFVDLAHLDLLLLRASPLDPAVLTFSALARDRGVLVVNDPNGLLRVSHKAWLASLWGIRTPETLVTHSLGTAHLFFEQQSDGVVVKPARGSGGRGVSLVEGGRHDHLDEAFTLAGQAGDGYVVVQEYLSEAEDGEKRLVWMDGTVLGGYRRLRAPGDFRHNLKRGGLAESCDVSDSEREIVSRISPHLLSAGIRMAGIDLIGHYVTEVNALNPGGAFHTDRLNGSHLAENIIGRLEQLCSSRHLETIAWAPPAP